MKKNTIYFILLLLLFSYSNVLADENLTYQINLADQLYKDFLQTNNPVSIKEAKTIFDNLLVSHSNHAELQWKAARCYNEFATISADPVQAYETGIELAKQSIALKDNPDAHFWLAILYGQIGQKKGIFKSLFMVKDIRSELEQCLALDPNFDYAYHVLSRLYLEVPGKPFSIGSKEKALEYELMAVELVPNHFPYQWKLYKLYRQLNKDQKAIEVLKTILSLPLDYDFNHVYREDLTATEIKKKAAAEYNRFSD